MDNRVKFYSWLIGLLDRKHLTFEEIANEWRDANANQDEDELDKRTFHRYRENIQSQFGITVECDKSDGYRYYLKRDPIANDDVTEWMLSSLRLASLGDMLKFHNKVMLDTPPYNTEYLDDILSAIDKQYLLKFKYVSGFGAESDGLQRIHYQGGCSYKYSLVATTHTPREWQTALMAHGNLCAQ